MKVVGIILISILPSTIFRTTLLPERFNFICQAVLVAMSINGLNTMASSRVVGEDWQNILLKTYFEKDVVHGITEIKLIEVEALWNPYQL